MIILIDRFDLVVDRVASKPVSQILTCDLVTRLAVGWC